MDLLKNLSASQPIGVFDSGIGGLTVAHAIANRLPFEQLIYFGDTAHLPYGDKSGDAIRYYSLKIAKFLLEQEAKMIVIACNSASTAASRVLAEFFPDQVHFVNVVDPLVEAVVSRNLKKVGIIATKATISSGVYQQQLKQAQPDLEVFALATPLLVPMIEEGYADSRISQPIIDNYLSDPGFENMDALLLACTHYPLIRQEIEDYFQGKVEVLDSTLVATDAVYDSLERSNLLSTSLQTPHQFYVSDHTPSFEATTKLFYGAEIQLKHFPLW
ncbi:MAG: glutamate racemase [Saprospiraceae bacterium]|nr:glutamate racemase [Saprospiraceae bacterium]